MNQNHQPTPVPVLTLLTLPSEIQTNICAHLVPSHETFLLPHPTTSPTSPPTTTTTTTTTGIPPKIHGTPLLPSADSTTPQRPSTIFSTSNIDILTLLLLHSTLTPRLIHSLYSNNTFFAGDVATLLAWRATLSPTAISSVRTVWIDACGPATCFFRGYHYYYSWGRGPDEAILGVPVRFPGVRELRLGGVGPGVVQRRAFTYRGSKCVRDTEVGDVWSLGVGGLVGEIVGKGRGGEDDGGGGKVVGDGHGLSGGRVFCMRVDEALASMPRGTYRLHGTRIVRRGEAVRLGVREQEITDMRAVLVRAREACDELEALGLSEVSVHDAVQ